MRRRPADAEGRRSAIRGSVAFGALHFGLLLYWIVPALVPFTWLAVPAWAGAVLLLTGVTGLVGWLLHRALHDRSAPLWAALPIAWTAGEWLRAHLPGSFAFPWLGLGTTLTGTPELAGAAELVGARGLGAWIALVNGVVAGALLATSRRGRWRAGALALALTAAPMAWGEWRAATIETRPVARIAVLQPGVRVRQASGDRLDATLAALDDLVRRVPPGSVDLVVLPEAIVPRELTAAEPPAWVERIAAWAREVDAPVLFGAFGRAEAGAPGGAGDPARSGRFNSAFLMEPRGLAEFRYDKRHLVPGVERTPVPPGPWWSRSARFGGFGVGRGWPLAEVEGVRYGAMICYESSYPEVSRRLRLAGADALVNLTNDAWFGGARWYERTTALWQHPAHLVMRAIENRVGVARAANGGFSLFVDPVGRIHEVSAPFDPDVRIATLLTTDRPTPYTRFGDLAGVGAAWAALLLALAGRRAPPHVPAGSLDPSAGAS